MQKEIEYKNAKHWLEQLLTKKIQSNPQYSLRSFARQVGIAPSALSRILSGKRTFTLNLAIRISNALGLTPKDRDQLLAMISPPIKEVSTKKQSETKQLSVDCFNAMSEWYHFGIMQLFFLDDFVQDQKWMAKILGISQLEVKLAIERLLRLEILDKNEKGELFRTANQFATTTDISSAGLRLFQKQILEKAIVSLEEDQIFERDITSITVASNETQIELVKKEIKKFRLKMAKVLAEGPKTRVYNLGIHLIPVSDSTKGKKYEN
jgi:uncharacterized protein (TIGR02147 family)